MLISQLNKLVEQFAQRGTFASVIVVFAAYSALWIYTKTN